MKYGFIGTGTITEAMVIGLMSSSLAVEKVLVSPRNADIADSLSKRFDKVVVALNNQAVVENADVIVLAVRLQIAEQVLTEITIPREKKIISVIAATDHAKLSKWTGHPADTIVRAIPLPFVADRDGVTAVFPPDRAAEDFFSAMGSAVSCKTKTEFDLLAAASSTMGTYFGILEGLSAWLEKEGMDRDKAKSYLSPLFASLAHDARRASDASFTELRGRFSTKGGLNEQVFREFVDLGGMSSLDQAMDNVLTRIRS